MAVICARYPPITSAAIKMLTKGFNELVINIKTINITEEFNVLTINIKAVNKKLEIDY